MSNNKHTHPWILLWSVLVLLLAGCNSGDAEVTTSPTSEVAPTGTLVPTPTSTPIQVPTPTPTDVPVIATECPWDDSLLLGAWEGDTTVLDSGKPLGGSYIFTETDGTREYTYNPQAGRTHSGTWACIDSPEFTVLLESRTVGYSGVRSIAFDGTDKIVFETLAGDLRDYYRVDPDSLGALDEEFECLWDQSAIVGTWEGDRTILDSGEPYGGTITFSDSGDYFYTPMGKPGRSGTWACPNSNVPQIVFESEYGYPPAQRNIEFTGDGQMTLERIEEEGLFYDYFKVED